MIHKIEVETNIGMRADGVAMAWLWRQAVKHRVNEMAVRKHSIVFEVEQREGVDILPVEVRRDALVDLCRKADEFPQ